MEWTKGGQALLGGGVNECQMRQGSRQRFCCRIQVDISLTPPWKKMQGGKKLPYLINVAIQVIQECNGPSCGDAQLHVRAHEKVAKQADVSERERLP